MIKYRMASKITQTKSAKKLKIIYRLWITFFCIRPVFWIDSNSLCDYSASVEIRVGAAPYVTKNVTYDLARFLLVHVLFQPVPVLQKCNTFLLGASSAPMTERFIVEKLFNGSPAFLENRRLAGSAGSANGAGSGRGGAGSHGSLLGCPCFDD